MSLYEKIVTVYPELENYDFDIGDIILQNDGDSRGDYIKEWNHSTLARPTDEQLG